MDERRYYGLDALRGTMMMLGIVLHAASLYLTVAPPDLPIIADRQRSYLLDAVTYFIHSFRMPVFFVLAGFFACLLVEKRGMWGAYRNRAARILAPLLAAMLTILPPTLLFLADFAIGVRYGVHEVLPPLHLFQRLSEEAHAAGMPRDLFLGHLWFLYYLLFFYLLIPLCRLLGEKTRGRAASPAMALPFLGLHCAATLWPYTGGQVLGHFLFLTPHPPSLLYYGSFFVLGYVMHYHRGFLQALAAAVPWSGALSALLLPVALYLSYLEVVRGAIDPGLHAAVVIANGFCTWTLAYFFIGCALRYLDRAAPWILYASQSSYWVYLLHLPVVGLVGWSLVPYELPALVKFSIIVAATTLVCFTTYHHGVQRTWIGAFLNGRRFDSDWPWRRARPSAAESAVQRP